MRSCMAAPGSAFFCIIPTRRAADVSPPVLHPNRFKTGGLTSAARLSRLDPRAPNLLYPHQPGTQARQHPDIPPRRLPRCPTFANHGRGRRATDGLLSRHPGQRIPTMPMALIIGITGQDGSHLAELLLDKGYRVYCMVRRSSTENFSRIEHLRESIELVQGDLLDGVSITRLLEEIQPDEIYNLAAMSFVPTSWQQPVLTAEFTAVGVTRILEGMRQVCPKARFYQASSSEMFGKVQETPQGERTPFYPRSPYGVAKVYGHYITVNYRESY